MKLNQRPPFTPVSRAVSIRSVHIVGSVQAQRARIGPAGLVGSEANTDAGGGPTRQASRIYLPTYLRSTPITGASTLLRRSDCCTKVSLPVQLSLLHAHELA